MTGQRPPGKNGQVLGLAGTISVILDPKLLDLKQIVRGREHTKEYEGEGNFIASLRQGILSDTIRMNALF